MTSAMTDLLLQCCSCGQDLNLNSHTLACLCNMCNTCMEENRLTDTEGESNVGKCPKCREAFNVKESELSPFLATELKRRLPLECHSCSEENVVSVGKLLCQECGQIFCRSCNRVHMKFAKSHICKNLDGVSHSEWIEQVMSEKCLLHGKERDFFCDQCNTCFCDVCYKGGECPSRHSGCVGGTVLNVKEEVLRQKSEEAPVLEQEVKKFAMVVKESNEKLMRRSGELNTELDQKCLVIWQNYDEKVDCAWRDADELCDKLQGEKYDEEAQLRDQLAGNAAILSQIEMWLLSCEHLLHEAERNVDILCGLHALKWRVQTWQEKWNQPEEKIKPLPLLTQNVDSSSSLDQKEIPQLKGLIELTKKNLQKGLQIQSIHVTEEDGHIFLCDSKNKLLIELSEDGEFLHEFHLKDERDQNPNYVLTPYEVCSFSPDILVVRVEKAQIYFSERVKIRPFLKTKRIIKKEGKSFVSFCSNNDSIFVLGSDLTMSSFTKNGEEIQTIKLQIMWMDSCDAKVRVDPMTGNFWVSKRMYKFNEGNWCYEIVSFNSEGDKISFVKEKIAFNDFYFNKYGYIFFFNGPEICSSLSEKKLLVKCYPTPENIFVSENKIFISANCYHMPSISSFLIDYLY